MEPITQIAEPISITNPSEDKLEAIFRMQRQLMDRIGFEEVMDPITLAVGDGRLFTPREVYLKWMYENIGTFCTCISQEAAELRDWTPWKHWSKRLGNKSAVPEGSEEHLHEIDMEIIDLFHFVTELCIIRRITPERLLEVYTEKNKINHERQDTGTY